MTAEFGAFDAVRATCGRVLAARHLAEDRRAGRRPRSVDRRRGSERGAGRRPRAARAAASGSCRFQSRVKRFELSARAASIADIQRHKLASTAMTRRHSAFSRVLIDGRGIVRRSSGLCCLRPDVNSADSMPCRLLRIQRRVAAMNAFSAHSRASQAAARHVVRMTRLAAAPIAQENACPCRLRSSPISSLRVGARAGGVRVAEHADDRCGQRYRAAAAERAVVDSIPTVHVATAKGWPPGAKPTPASGLAVNCVRGRSRASALALCAAEWRRARRRNRCAAETRRSQGHQGLGHEAS